MQKIINSMVKIFPIVFNLSYWNSDKLSSDHFLLVLFTVLQKAYEDIKVRSISLVGFALIWQRVLEHQRMLDKLSRKY